MHIYAEPFIHTTGGEVIHAAIIGASGYSGAELLRLLAQRTDVSVDVITAGASAGKSVDEVYPAFSGTIDLRFTSLDYASLEGMDIVFVALPSGEAMSVVPQLMGKVGRIIDLGGDFRLSSTSLYSRYYGRAHTAPELLGTAVYGLPEIFKEQIAAAAFVANPGCYPTSAILPLYPLLKSGCVSPAGIVINSVSGVSGAGRSSSVEMSFAEVNENVRAYKVGRHQHIPEMEMVLSKGAGAEVTLSFVPHLVPITRGIYSTIHATLAKSCDAAALSEVYRNAYADASFVRIRESIPQIKDVVNSNFCDIGFTVDQRTGQVIITSTIDNLVKGAAGQAIQNMNIMFALPEGLGLGTRKEEAYV